MATSAYEFFVERLKATTPGRNEPAWAAYRQITDLQDPERSEFISELLAGYHESLPQEEVLIVLEALEADELVPLVEAKWDEAVTSLGRPNLPTGDERWPNLCLLYTSDAADE